MTDRPAPQKSADAYRTISEVADELKLPHHVLRFWETRFPQVKPLKRAGGRRFYRPEDVGLLRAVKALLYEEGYTIKGVQRLLAEFGGRHVAEALARRSAIEGEVFPDADPKRSAGVMPEEVSDACGSALAGSRAMPHPVRPVRRQPCPAPTSAVGDLAVRLGEVLDDLAECGRLLSHVRTIGD